MKITIFDFDGVIADSFHELYSFNKDTFSSINVNITEEEYRKFFNTNAHLAFREFIKDKKLYNTFLKFRKDNLYNYYSKIKFFPDAVDFLKQLHKDHTLTIASSTPADFISKLLKKNKIQDLFSLVLGTREHSKENILKITSAKLNAPLNTMTMVTDTVGDLKIAKKLGIKTIAVTWGFHSSNTLKQAEPDVIVSTFNELSSSLE